MDTVLLNFPQNMNYTFYFGILTSSHLPNLAKEIQGNLTGATSDQTIVLKWPLDLSFTAYYEVRTLRNVFLCAYCTFSCYNLIWSRHVQQSLPRKVKYLRFLRTLNSSGVALNHLTTEIVTGIYRSSF